MFATSYYVVQRTCQVRLFSDTLARGNYEGVMAGERLEAARPLDVEPHPGGGEERQGTDDDVVAFDQAEWRQGFLGKKALVTETDETVGKLARVEPQVFRVEFLVPAPVANGDVQQHAFASERGKDVGIGWR